jgi:cellulose synthase/poly-beta-1,6-N-acetylglucosamine synthase-like glycosyltransferase
VTLIIAAIRGQLGLFLVLSLITIGYDLLQWLLVIRFAWLGAIKPRFPPHKGKIPSIAVVIPTWNEEKALPSTLTTILNQDDPPEQIIVVDDGSTDKTLTLLHNLYQLEYDGNIAKSQLYPHIQVLSKEHSGKGDSLNKGIFLSNTDIVLTLDADTTLDSQSIKALRQTFTQYSSLIAVSGTLIPCCLNNIRGKIFQFFQRYEYARTHVWRLAWSYLNSNLIVSGACAAFKRETLLEIGGFNPHSWVEDYEVMYRLQSYLRQQKRPCQIMIQPLLLVQTEAPDTIYGFLRQRRRWAGGFLQTLLQYRNMTGDRRLGILGCGYLIHNVFTIANPFYSWVWLIAGLILFWQDQKTHTYLSVLGLIFIAIIVISSILIIALYRYYFRRDEVSWQGTIWELFLRPFFYLHLVVISHIWGYFSCLVRQRSW